MNDQSSSAWTWSVYEQVVRVHALLTSERIISLRAAVKSIADTDPSNLGEYLGAASLKPFIDRDLVLGEFKGWEADRIASFFGGIAQVLTAKGKMEEKATAPTDQ